MNPGIHFALSGALESWGTAVLLLGIVWIFTALASRRASR